ncbi:MAG TPA: YggT family protein [Paracoccaceae bacterium]|nr:YggT family protein [Paracoccaceae bacterium]
MDSIRAILYLVLDVLIYIVLAHVIMSWLISFQVLNIRQRLVSQIWYGLDRLLDPIYRRIRSVLPDLGGIDLSPLILLLGIFALQIVIRNNPW